MSLSKLSQYPDIIAMIVHKVWMPRWEIVMARICGYALLNDFLHFLTVKKLWSFSRESLLKARVSFQWNGLFFRRNLRQIAFWFQGKKIPSNYTVDRRSDFIGIRFESESIPIFETFFRFVWTVCVCIFFPMKRGKIQCTEKAATFWFTAVRGSPKPAYSNAAFIYSVCGYRGFWKDNRLSENRDKATEKADCLAFMKRKFGLFGISDFLPFCPFWILRWFLSEVTGGFCPPSCYLCFPGGRRK